MDFNLQKSIEIILQNDNFHKNFFIEDIKSSTKVLELLNKNDQTNLIIKKALHFGYIIVFSESSKKYFLFFRDPNFVNTYTYILRFKNDVDRELNNYPSINISYIVIKYFNYTMQTGEYIFNKIVNRQPYILKCVNCLEYPNDYVIKYSHDMRLPERIQRNPNFNEISVGRTSYYNFIIDNRGIVIGEVIDSLENGVVHHLLVDNPEDEVFIAGEIKIENNNLLYNLFSGTYSKPQNTINNPILEYYLEIVLNKIFKIHKVGTRPLENIKLVYDVLLPRKPFSKHEIELFCSKFRNKIVKIPYGNRCINNTYGDLTQTVKTQIEDSFTNNTNLLCNDYSDLFRDRSVIERPVSEDSIFDVIEFELKKFGLKDIKLGSYSDMESQFKRLLVNPQSFATFKDGVIVDPSGNKSVEYEKLNPNGTTERKIFTFKKTLSSGSFNKTEIYTEKILYKTGIHESGITEKEYIFRSSINTSVNQFKSFYENLKHIILYVLLRKYLNNLKFIPQPYYFGLKKNLDGTIIIYMIMEKGENTLDDYFAKPEVTFDEIKKIIFSIYADLYDLNSISFHDNSKLNFKHNDLKCNNAVISVKKTPLLIDFGLSMFRLKDIRRGEIKFISCESGIRSRYYDDNNKNIVHDMFHLISSLNFISKPGLRAFDVLKFTQNIGSNIFDTPNITNIINTIYNTKLLFGVIPGGIQRITDYDLFRLFYDTFNLDDPRISDLMRTNNFNINITPEQLAINIDLRIGDRIIDRFENKYLKYKQKYLKLSKLRGSGKNCSNP